MEKTLAIELVKQQLDHDLAQRKPFVSVIEGGANMNRVTHYLWNEVVADRKDLSIERMTQTAVVVAAEALKFIVDLM